MNEAKSSEARSCGECIFVGYVRPVGREAASGIHYAARSAPLSPSPCAMVMPVGCDLTWVDRMPASRDASRFRTCASWLAAQRPHGTRYAPQAHSEFCAHPSPVHMRLLAARSHHPLVSCVMQLSLTRAKPDENEIAAKRHRGTPTVATRAGAHVFPPSNEPLAEVGACRRCELLPVAGMANIGL